MKNITRTLNEFVSPIRLTKVGGRELGLEMNALIRSGFNFYRGTFADRKVELVIAEVLNPGRVDVLARQYARFLKQIKSSLLFYFDELKPRERSRLVKHKVQFIVADKFLHVPALGIAGDVPIFEGNWNSSIADTQLSAWAETIVIKRLLDDQIELATGNQLAELFHVTTMTISRALREIESLDLCVLEPHGTEKRARFESKELLWSRARRILTSPVLATIDLAELPVELPLSGDPALEHYTMISGIPPKTYAIYKREFLKLKREQKIRLPRVGEEKLRLQLWKRDPKALAQGKYIDPVSLFFSEMNSTDDRVQVETHRMMKDLGLGVPEDG